MKLNKLNIQTTFFVLKFKKLKLEWLTVRVIYIMLPAMPRISKYMCLMFIYFSKLLSLYLFRFLRPFATFRKAITSFVVSVCPPVRKKKLDS
jgi:hypothetical protein